MSEKWPIREVLFALTIPDLTSLCRSNRNWHRLVGIYYYTHSTLLTMYFWINTYFGHYWLPLMGGTISSSRKMPSSERTETRSCSKIMKLLKDYEWQWNKMSHMWMNKFMYKYLNIVNEIYLKMLQMLALTQ